MRKVVMAGFEVAALAALPTGWKATVPVHVKSSPDDAPTTTEDRDWVALLVMHEFEGEGPERCVKSSHVTFGVVEGITVRALEEPAALRFVPPR
jgi:hypothetical protein